MHGDAHARAFTVAKVAKLDLLQDIRSAVETALTGGKSQHWFRKELEPVLRKKGWWGKQVDVDPITGEAQLYQAGSWRRLETIYRTNLQTAYQAGRWKQFEAERSRAPYIQYLAVMDSRTRPARAALHGQVFHIDDPAWSIIATPNGFNCRCRTRNLSAREMERRGLHVAGVTQTHVREAPGRPPVDLRTGETAGWKQRGVSIPDPARPGERIYLWADPGWDYNPGRSAGDFFTPPRIDTPPPIRWGKNPICPRGSAEFSSGGCPGPMPAPRAFDPQRLLEPGREDRYYVRQFLAEFEADFGQPALFEDVTGEPLLITADMFLDKGKSSALLLPVYKVQKNGREVYLPMLAETIKRPQEIWESVEWHGAKDKAVLRRRYLAWWDIDGQEKPGLSVFEWSTQWWAGVTSFVPERHDLAEYLDNQRKGILKWKG
jgi:SPP1 gp7 family putative phage head morphogenesis protein